MVSSRGVAVVISVLLALFVTGGPAYAAPLSPGDTADQARQVEPAEPVAVSGTVEVARPADTPRGPATTLPLAVLEGKYRELGGPASPLGNQVWPEECNLRSGGCRRLYEHGAIYWSPPTGAQAVWGAVQRAWISWGAQDGPLGYPTGPMSCSPQACSQDFEGGVLLGNEAEGAHPVWGEIGRKWRALGALRGPLGVPTRDESCKLRNGGCRQEFRGGVLYWSPASGAHPVWGLIANKWRAEGAENGWLGYPVGDERCGLREGGCFQAYQGGAIYWSSTAGAHYVRGMIAAKWAQRGWENGLGYPLTDELCGLRNGGCWQAFQRGPVYWSPTTPAVPVVGNIYGQWAANGFENGRFGYPAAEQTNSSGTARQQFQGGLITANG